MASLVYTETTSFVGKEDLQKLSVNISWARYVTRLLYLPSAIEASVSGSWASDSKRHPEVFHQIGRLLACSMVVYYLAEYLAYLQWTAPTWLNDADGQSANWFSRLSCAGWLFYTILYAVQCVLQWLELKHTQSKVLKDGEAAEDVKGLLLLLEVQFIRHFLWIWPAFYWSIGISEGQLPFSMGWSAIEVNILMWMESVLHLYQLVAI